MSVDDNKCWCVLNLKIGMFKNKVSENKDCI